MKNDFHNYLPTVMFCVNRVKLNCVAVGTNFISIWFFCKDYLMKTFFIDHGFFDVAPTVTGLVSFDTSKYYAETLNRNTIYNIYSGVIWRFCSLPFLFIIFLKECTIYLSKTIPYNLQEALRVCLHSYQLSCLGLQ